MARRSDRMDTIVSLCKRRGIVFPSSEIYGGLRASWDAREVWEASGHVTEFTDPLTECMSCHRRFRADDLIEAYEEKHGHPPQDGLSQLACPNCGTRGAFTEPRNFNGLLRTYLGPVEDESGLAYLRPETAQGIFINYRNVLRRPARRSRSASARSASPSATRSPPATSSSAPGSSSRWRWNSSSSPAPTRNGTSAGSTRGLTGISAWASARTTCDFTSTRRKSCRTTRSGPSTSSTNLTSLAASGASLRESRTAPTST